VLLNLVGNAIKFTRSGHVLIELETLTRQSDGQHWVRCSVTDTGIGIPTEKQPLLFQHFTQADTSTTREFGGTGLGLAIVKRLVELMGGQLGFTSEPDRGSQFWFTLPAPAAEAVSGEPLDVEQGVAQMRVLVVDDHEINRKLMSEQLAAWRLEYACASSGVEALEKLAAARDAGQPFDVAVIDFLMPGMDGLELGIRIKQDTSLQHTALVMLTSGSQRSAAPTFLAAGFSVFMMKPVVRPSQLLDALVKAFRDSKSLGIPALQSPAPAAPMPASPVAGSVATAAQGARVLVAEDNVVNQRLVKHMLEKLGCRIDLASNGREAVQMAAQTAYDIVFMDCFMPELDGYGATAQLRENEEDGRHLPNVALTANAMAEDRARCLAAGMDDYLSKPVRQEEIRAMLARWLPPVSREQKIG
jgi:CheY-like chemotaxis protein